MACSNLIKKKRFITVCKKSSNHPPQIIKQLPKIISDRFSKHSINEEVFNESKGEYENPLKQSGYNNINLKFQPLITSNETKAPSEHLIIWFNPPFICSVSTNVLISLLDVFFLMHCFLYIFLLFL